MRKVSLIGAAILSLAAASSAFAATPAAVPTTPTAVQAPAAHHWTASFKGDGLRVRARLFAASGWRFGWLEVQVRGLKAGSKVEVTLADQTTTMTLVDATKSVRSHSGVRAFLVHLDAKQMAALKSDVTAKDTLTVTVTSGTATASGNLAAAKG